PRVVPRDPAPPCSARAPARRGRTGLRPPAARSTASGTARAGTPGSPPRRRPPPPEKSPSRGSGRDRRTSPSARVRRCTCSAGTCRSWGRTLSAPPPRRQGSALGLRPARRELFLQPVAGLADGENVPGSGRVRLELATQLRDVRV